MYSGSAGNRVGAYIVFDETDTPEVVEAAMVVIDDNKKMFLEVVVVVFTRVLVRDNVDLKLFSIASSVCPLALPFFFSY